MLQPHLQVRKWFLIQIPMQFRVPRIDTFRKPASNNHVRNIL